MSNRNMLLVDSATPKGGAYMSHCRGEISAMLGDKVKRVLFLPFARMDRLDYDEYTCMASNFFRGIGYELNGLHTSKFHERSLKEADAVFVGGGNIFLLVNELRKRDGLFFGKAVGKEFSHIQGRIDEGMPFIGVDAGTVVAGMTIRTTNDMIYLLPDNLDALDLVPFALHTGYVDRSEIPTHGSWGSEGKINGFHQYHDTPVVGLREGSMLRVEGNSVELKGRFGARSFVKGKEPKDHHIGDSLDFLLE